MIEGFGEKGNDELDKEEEEDEEDEDLDVGPDFDSDSFFSLQYLRLSQMTRTTAMHMSAKQPTTPPIMAPMVLGLLMLNVLLLLLLVLLVLLVLPLLMSMSLLLLMSPLEPEVEDADAVVSEAEDGFGGKVVETAGLVVGGAEEVVGARADVEVEAAVEVILVVEGTGSGVTACFVVKAR